MSDKKCTTKKCNNFAAKRRNICNSCKSKRFRKRFPNYDLYHKKTITGYLTNTYGNMKRRVYGNCDFPQYWKGKAILSREQFIDWARNNKDFLKLHKEWVINNYDYRLSPSINRIDSKKGYLLGNIEWITHALNSSLAGSVRKNKNSEKKLIYKILGVGK